MKRLAELRKKHGLSQDELAEKVGVSQQTMSKYERGALEPDFETLNFLADYFSVSIDYLLDRDESQRQHVNDDETLEIMEILHKRPEMKILFNAGRKATKEDVLKAVAIVEALRRQSEGED